MKPRLQRLQGVVAKEILDAMRESTVRLRAAGVRHALIGGLAVGAYGHIRATKDVDFIVGDEAFEAHEGGVLLFNQGVPYAIGTVPVDCIPAGDEKHIIAALDKSPLSDGVPVAPVEVVIALKLYAGRRQDLADVASLLEVATVDVELVRSYLEQYPDAAEEFDRLVTR